MLAAGVVFKCLNIFQSSIHAKIWSLVLRWSKVSWHTPQIQDVPLRHLDEQHGIRASRTDRTDGMDKTDPMNDGATRVLEGPSENADWFSTSA